MRNVLKHDFTEYLYGRLPKVYRDSDKDGQLKNFISAIVDGGIKISLHETVAIMNLIDIRTCPPKYIPLLCNKFGMPYYPEISEHFQRKLLNNFSILISRKGTKSAIEYLVRVLSGYDTTLELYDTDIYQANIYIYEDQEISLLTAQGVINKYIKHFAPIGISLELVTVYWFSDEADFITFTEEEHIDLLIDFHSENYSLQSCEYEYYNAIIENMGEEISGDLVIGSDESYSVTNEITNEWFVSNGINGFDLVFTEGQITQTHYF